MMPPLASNLPSETIQLISSAQRHQTDLSEFQIPRLQTCKGPLSLQQNLAAELREDIEAFARQVEALDISVGDLRGDTSRKELGGIVTELKEALGRIRQDSRAALLSSKRTIDSQRKGQRDELFASSAVVEKRNENEKVTDDTLMKANADVTEALRRTIGLMQSELERSVLSVQMLDSSTATLRSTSTTHDTLSTVLGASKQLVTALEKSDWLDRVLILSAFVFFVLVVLFIVKQRVVDKGVRIAFWWTRFLPDFTGEEALLAHGMEDLQKGTDVFELVQSSASAVSVITTSVTSAIASLVVSASPPTPPPSLTTEHHEDRGAHGSSDQPDLEMTFSQTTSPTSSTPGYEPTISTTIHDDTPTWTSEYHTRAVDEL